MVIRRGPFEEPGTVPYDENRDELFLGMSVLRTRNASKATVQNIRVGIKRLADEAKAHAFSPGSAPTLRRRRKACWIRDADRRRDHRSARRQEAEPRIGAGADRPAYSAVPPAGKPRRRLDPDARL
jgi:cell division protease FtsH